MVLPVNSLTFELKFELLAGTSDEIFLQFAQPGQEKDWFYTFNSADIRLRKQFPKNIGVLGEDYYPVVGGLFIKNSQDLLQIFPKFPLGVGMPFDGAFELHLHRNPQNDDFLGLGVPMKDTSPVLHEFLIRIGDFNSTRIWRDYLCHKNSVIIFAVAEREEDISLKLENNLDRYEDWTANTEYSLTDENSCVYLSSLGVNQEKMYVKVLNLCEYPQNFSLNSTQIISQVLINERLEVNKTLEVYVHDEITFKANSNSGKSVVRYAYENQEDMISSFNFIGYEIDHTCALYHPSEVKECEIIALEKDSLEQDTDYLTHEVILILYIMISMLLLTSVVYVVLRMIFGKKPEKTL